MATAAEIIQKIRTENPDYDFKDHLYEIDVELREIQPPKDGNTLGTVSDALTNLVNFKCPKVYNGIDLSEFNNIIVKYIIPTGDINYSDAVITSIEEQYMYFTWVVPAYATQVDGDVAFLACIRDLDEEKKTLQEFNTGMAQAPVKKGILLNDEEYEADLTDLRTKILQEFESDANDIATEHIANIENSGANTELKLEEKAKQVIESLPEDYVELSNEVNKLGSDLDNNIYDIENLKYIMKKAVFNGFLHNTKNYTEVGNPKIDGGWVMNADASNYVVCPEVFSPTGTWEIVIKFITTDNYGYQDILCTMVDDVIKTGIIIEGSYNNESSVAFNAFIKEDGNTSNTRIGIGAIPIGEWTTIGVGYDGTNLYTYVKTESGSYEYSRSVAGNNISTGFTVGIGNQKNGALTGKIDLSECYIKQNDTIWWRAVK